MGIRTVFEKDLVKSGEHFPKYLRNNNKLYENNLGSETEYLPLQTFILTKFHNAKNNIRFLKLIT